MTLSLTLPSIFANLNEARAAENLLDAVEKQLQQLKIQAAAFEIQTLFNEFPSLQSLSIEFKTILMSDDTLELEPVGRVQLQDQGSPPDPFINAAVHLKFKGVINRMAQMDDDVLERLETRSFNRTTDSSEQLDAIMSVFLDPLELAHWQKTLLKHHTTLPLTSTDKDSLGLSVLGNTEALKQKLKLSHETQKTPKSSSKIL